MMISQVRQKDGAIAAGDEEEDDEDDEEEDGEEEDEEGEEEGEEIDEVEEDEEVEEEEVVDVGEMEEDALEAALRSGELVPITNDNNSGGLITNGNGVIIVNNDLTSPHLASPSHSDLDVDDDEDASSDGDVDYDSIIDYGDRVVAASPMMQTPEYSPKYASDTTAVSPAQPSRDRRQSQAFGLQQQQQQMEEGAANGGGGSGGRGRRGSDHRKHKRNFTQAAMAFFSRK